MNQFETRPARLALLTLPELPILPTVPGLSFLPYLPHLPHLPHLPSLPTLPTLATLPTTHQLKPPASGYTDIYLSHPLPPPPLPHTKPACAVLCTCRPDKWSHVGRGGMERQSRCTDKVEGKKSTKICW